MENKILFGKPLIKFPHKLEHSLVSCFFFSRTSYYYLLFEGVKDYSRRTDSLYIIITPEHSSRFPRPFSADDDSRGGRALKTGKKKYICMYEDLQE